MASTDQQPPVSLNGRITSADQPALMHNERGFTLGDGVFDSMLVLEGDMQDGHAHFARLLHHYAVLTGAKTAPLSIETLSARAKDLIAAQDDTHSTNSLVLRTTLTTGPGGRGLTAPEVGEPTCLMALSPAPPPADDAPITAIIADSVRRNEHSPLSQIKSLNYGDQLIAHREAQAEGAQEAILLNTAGHVACATVGNIVIVEDGQWLTPPQADGAMDGTQRAKLINDGMREASITPERLRQAESIYSCNCVRGMQPLKMIG